jgi:hypothetical protein
MCFQIFYNVIYCQSVVVPKVILKYIFCASLLFMVQVSLAYNKAASEGMLCRLNFVSVVTQSHYFLLCTGRYFYINVLFFSRYYISK